MISDNSWDFVNAWSFSFLSRYWWDMLCFWHSIIADVVYQQISMENIQCACKHKETLYENLSVTIKNFPIFNMVERHHLSGHQQQTT